MKEYKKRILSAGKSRREFLRNGLHGVLAAGLWPGAIAAQAFDEKGDDLQYVIINDTHYRDERCGEYLTKAVKWIKSRHEKLDFCLVAGDLATDGKEHELKPFREIMEAMPCPVYVVPGNHDFDGESCGVYEEIFPNSRNYVKHVKGWTLLGLDSCDGPRYKDTQIQEDSLKWLRKTIDENDSKKPMIVFTHFPMGEETPMRPKNADEVLNLLVDCNVKAIYSGHFHGFTLKRWNEIPLTTNRCLSYSRGNHDGSEEKGYFICKVKEGEITRKFIEFLG